MAVLSIVLTAPLGTVGIMILGKKILDDGERISFRFRDLCEKLQLPRVGERVSNKHFGTVWKIIEALEIWLERPGCALPSEMMPALIPAIQIRYWREATDMEPGTGKTMIYQYSQDDFTFNEHWETLYVW